LTGVEVEIPSRLKKKIFFQLYLKRRKKERKKDERKKEIKKELLPSTQRCGTQNVEAL
jgi:hypothetical protein